VWVRITSYKRKYYISRTDRGDETTRTDDEAQLEIRGTIVAITPAQKKHLDAAMEISLLCAQDYSPGSNKASPFFGSVTLRGSQRSALAYLPPKPFWELPGLISEGSNWLCLGWSAIHRGWGEVTSVFVGDEADLEQLGSTCIRAVKDVGVKPGS
jgi:hypothetical protein